MPTKYKPVTNEFGSVWSTLAQIILDEVLELVGENGNGPGVNLREKIPL